MEMLLHSPSAFLLVVAPTISFFLYYVYWQLTIGAARRAMIRQHGCKPIRNTPELYSFPNNIVGISTMRKTLQASKEHKILETLYGRYKRNGNTIHYKTLNEDMIYTIEPENLKAILATHFNDWRLSDRRQKAFLQFFGAGIFSANGPAWQHSRELLRPNFVRSQVGDLVIFERHVAQLVATLPRDGSTVDLQELFFRLTMDTSTEFLVGESTDTLASNRGVAVMEAFDRCQAELSHCIRTGYLHPIFRPAQFPKDVKTVWDWLDGYVEQAMAQHRSSTAAEEGKTEMEKEKKEKPQAERYVFLPALVESIPDPVRIRSELINILLAGRDTTASLLSSVFFTLARRPDVWAKLKAEVDELDGRIPTWEQLKDMKYLRRVMNETLRLYPVVPANSRQASVDTVLPLGGGADGKSPLFVPGGTVVNYLVYGMHRRPDLWGDESEHFDPDRWEAGRMTQQPGWGFLPFNGGPRICIGQQFALTEAGYTIVRLLQGPLKAGIEARLEGEDDGEDVKWRERLGLTCCILQGVKVGIKD